MELTNLAKGSSIKQRFKLLTQYYQEKNEEYQNDDLLNFVAWRSRPSLVTEEQFEEILQQLNLSKKEFDFAIKELTIDEKSYLAKELASEDWFILTKEILSRSDLHAEDIKDPKKANFTYITRLHIDYLEIKVSEIVREFPDIVISQQAQEKYIAEVINRFMDIGLRTFVYELHENKETMELIEEDEKTRFHEYLANRFYEKKELINFFTKYPVLTRLIAQIIIDQLINFRQLLNSISESKFELATVLDVLLPVCVEGLSMGAGDSHDKGKTVSIVTFTNKIEVVYKPKDLTISSQFDCFVGELKRLDPKINFYLTKKIVKKEYSFEERLTHIACETKDDVRHFYHQFGQTIALVYLLNGNDFHLENVLAHGKYPVLIDLETIIQNHFPMQDSQNALVKVMQKNGESIVMSGLVPIYLFEERIEKDVEGANQGIQLSALSGDKQKLPYKILKLVNFDSDNMQFTYQEHMTDGSENIPIFEGENVDFVPYIDEIINGFQDFSEFARTYKTELDLAAKKIFAGALVRNVIKTTQSYGDLLEYSTHPSCMVNYIEREKLFENLWVHNYINSGPVPYEIRDMLRHDVPIFFNRTDSKNLIASQGECIPDMYQIAAINLESQRLQNFSKEEELEQMDYLKTSFGLYHPMDLQERKIPLADKGTKDLLLDGAIEIGKSILADAFIGEDSIAWKDVEEASIDNYIINVMNENLYDGVTGVYLFLTELYYVSKNELFKQAAESAEALVIQLQDEYIDSISAFYGSFSAIYPLLYSYKHSHKSNLLVVAEKIAEDYIQAYKPDEIESYDWTGGTASIIKVFTVLYQVTGKVSYYQFSKRMLLDLDLSKITQGGFAHGYSGIIYAANAVLKLRKDTKIIKFIQDCLEKERLTFDFAQNGWLDTRPNPPVVNDLWCYGSLGIGMAYLDLALSGFDDSDLPEEIKLATQRILDQQKQDDCLCHGDLGDLEFLLQVLDTEYCTVEQKQEIEVRIQKRFEKTKDGHYLFEGLDTVPKQGLFTGFSGIGHELLRLRDKERIANILTLEVPDWDKEARM